MQGGRPLTSLRQFYHPHFRQEERRLSAAEDLTNGGIGNFASRRAARFSRGIIDCLLGLPGRHRLVHNLFRLALQLCGARGSLLKPAALKLQEPFPVKDNLYTLQSAPEGSLKGADAAP